MNVDDAMRRFRASIPGPSDALVMRIVESTTSGVHRSPRRRHVSSRTVLVTATVMTALVVIVALGFLIRGGAGPSAAPAAPAIPPARVDWGMVATVKLKPDPGISIDEMRERFTTALAFRVHDDDGAGVEIIDHAGDTVRVRLPGAELTGQAQSYLRFSRVVLVADTEDVLASGPRLRSLAAAAQASIGPSTPVSYYVQSVEGGGSVVNVPKRFESRAQALANVKRIGKRNADLLAVPRSMAVVTSPASTPGMTVRLVRPTTTLPSSAIRDVSTADGSVTITVDPSATPSHDVRVRVFRDDSGTGRLGGLAMDVAVGVLGTDGRLTVTTKPSWAAPVPRMDIGGRVVVENAVRYGSRPPIAGRVFIPSRKTYPFEATRSRPVARWVRAAEGQTGGRRVVLMVGETNGVVSFMGLLNPRDPERPMTGMGSSLVTFRDMRTNSRYDSACPYNVGTPRVAVCNGGLGTSIVSGPGHHVATTVAFGAFQPGVAKVAVEWGGVRRYAVVQNGWWFAQTSVNLAKRGRPRSGEPLGNVGMPSILAWDSDGNPVPVPSQMRL